jgi:hypothetical protein
MLGICHLNDYFSKARKRNNFKMKYIYTVLVVTFLAFSSLNNIANAGPIKVNINNLDTLTADYSQSNVGDFSTIPGGVNGRTFHSANFGNLNGTTATNDASKDSATFKLSVKNLIGFSGNPNKNQYFFESGGTGSGVGIFYNNNNEIVFSQRNKKPGTNQNLINTISIDASGLIGTNFDVIATISFEDNLMRLIVGGNLYAGVSLLDESNDWSGRNGGAFGQGNNSVVSGSGSGRLFNSGQVADFSYFHDVVIFVPEPSSIAILALAIIGLTFRRIKK